MSAEKWTVIYSTVTWTQEVYDDFAEAMAEAGRAAVRPGASVVSIESSDGTKVSVARYSS